MKDIQSGLIELRKGGCTPIGLTYLVEPKHNKTGNPFYDKPTTSWLIEKIGDINAFTGCQYGSVVNNQLAREEKETDFKPLELWKGKGKHLDNFIAYHTEKLKYYLKVLPRTVQFGDEFDVQARVQYRWIATGKPLSETELATLETFEPPKSTSSRQGTEKPVFWMTIEIGNILSLRFGGQNYQINS